LIDILLLDRISSLELFEELQFVVSTAIVAKEAAVVAVAAASVG